MELGEVALKGIAELRGLSAEETEAIRALQAADSAAVAVATSMSPPCSYMNSSNRVVAGRTSPPFLLFVWVVR